MAVLPETATINIAIERAVNDAISSHVQEIKEQLIKDTVSKFEKEIKRLVGNVAISLSNLYSIERVGQDLLIRVKIDSSK